MEATSASMTEAVLARHADEPGPLLPILHGVQDALGHVPRDIVPMIAEALNLSRAEVHGVVTYYHHFRSEKPGRHVVRVCRAEACLAMGADALMAHAERTLACRADGGRGAPGPDPSRGTPAAHASAHGCTSADGRYTLLSVYCLGLCASSPAMSIDDRPHARLTPAGFDRIVGALEGRA